MDVLKKELSSTSLKIFFSDDDISSPARLTEMLTFETYWEMLILYKICFMP